VTGEDDRSLGEQARSLGDRDDVACQDIAGVWIGR
jgi:hypothetical protein